MTIVGHYQLEESRGLIESNALAISSLRSSKDLPDPYKDHPLHKSSIDEETPIAVVEQDSSS